MSLKKNVILSILGATLMSVSLPASGQALVEQTFETRNVSLRGRTLTAFLHESSSIEPLQTNPAIEDITFPMGQSVKIVNVSDDIETPISESETSDTSNANGNPIDTSPTGILGTKLDPKAVSRRVIYYDSRPNAIPQSASATETTNPVKQGYAATNITPEIQNTATQTAPVRTSETATPPSIQPTTIYPQTNQPITAKSQLDISDYPAAKIINTSPKAPSNHEINVPRKAIATPTITNQHETAAGRAHAFRTATPPSQYQTYAKTPGMIDALAALYTHIQTGIARRAETNFSSAVDVKDGLIEIGGINAEQTTRASVAFAALIVAEQPQFQQSVLAQSHAQSRDAYLASISRNPYYALHLNGAQSAINKALSVVAADFRHLRRAGQIMKDSSYSLQENAWARKNIVKKAGLIADLETKSQLRRASDNSAKQALKQTIELERSNAGLLQSIGIVQSLKGVGLGNALYSKAQPVSRFLNDDRSAAIATLAAFIVLDADRPDKTANINKLLRIAAANKTCVEMAQLNLKQCTAAMHKNYEIPYCVGEHALIEVAQCYS